MRVGDAPGPEPSLLMRAPGVVSWALGGGVLGGLASMAADVAVSRSPEIGKGTVLPVLVSVAAAVIVKLIRADTKITAGLGPQIAAIVASHTREIKEDVGGIREEHRLLREEQRDARESMRRTYREFTEQSRELSDAVHEMTDVLKEQRRQAEELGEIKEQNRKLKKDFDAIHSKYRSLEDDLVRRNLIADPRAPKDET